MKNILIIFIPLLVSCSGTDEKVNVKEVQCDLTDLKEEGAGLWGFHDFTIYDVEQSNMDSKGTFWEDQTKDEYRFVFKNDFDKVNLLVYKNKEFIISYEDLKEKSRRHIPRLYPQCELDWFKEEVFTEWRVKTKIDTTTIKSSETFMDKLKRINPSDRKILDLAMYKVSCYSSVWFYLDEKTKIYGTFKLHPQAGQECK